MTELKLTARVNNNWGVCLKDIPGDKGTVAEFLITTFGITPKDATLAQGKKQEIYLLTKANITGSKGEHYFRIDIREGKVWEDGKESRGEVVFLLFNLKLVWALPVNDFAQDMQKSLAEMQKVMREIEE